MLAGLNDAVLAVMDILVGWALYMPRDAALLVLGAGSSAILTLVRPLTTNQELLRRCIADRRRLGELMREARKRGDREAVRRGRGVRNMVSMKMFAAEGKPFLAAVVPIALLATWSFQRLAYLPPRPGEEVEVRAYLAPSARGRLIHLVPEEGLASAGGWIREVVPDADGGENAIAAWKLSAEARRGPYALTFRFGERTYESRLLAGGRNYSEPVVFFVDDDGDDEVICVETVLVPYRPFGLVPGDPASAFPPWLVAYLVVVVPFVFILKRVLRIA